MYNLNFNILYEVFYESTNVLKNGIREKHVPPGQPEI